jgi:crotonobetainyl-CoA:carnitine CoA-transferase CaiB-like acyl-CoA transferase
LGLICNTLLIREDVYNPAESTDKAAYRLNRSMLPGRLRGRPCSTRAGTDYSIASTPLTFGAEQRRLASVPPRLGEHTDEILTDLLEMSAVEVAALLSQGVVGERAAH